MATDNIKSLTFEYIGASIVSFDTSNIDLQINVCEENVGTPS